MLSLDVLHMLKASKQASNEVSRSAISKRYREPLLNFLKNLLALALKKNVLEDGPFALI